MQIETTDSVTAARTAYRLPMLNLRWGAIFAGLVVGISTNLLLMLAGAAVGLAAIDISDAPGGTTVTVAAGIWHTASMVVAAFAGAYVAARASGMRRSSDGLLHGVVAWGVTMVLSVMLAATLGGAALGNVMPAAATSPGVTAEVVRSVDAGQREAAVSALQERLGISAEQANRVVDQALILSGREEQATPQGREATEDAMRAASAASGWLSAAIVLSLLAAMGGGALGARGTRREVAVDHTLRRTRTVADVPPPRGRPAAT